MIWGKGHKPGAHWWFAWYPVQLTKSGRWIWLEEVYCTPAARDGSTLYTMSE